MAVCHQEAAADLQGGKMFDSHIHPDDWGIRPILFSIGRVEIASYSFFVLLGLVIGIITYIVLSKRNKTYNRNAFIVLIAAITFGTLGAKLPIWIANYKLIIANSADIQLIMSGRTIIGGLIGGTIGVILTKKVLKIKVRMGNQIAPAAAIGIAIGRIGCFFRGCCYGIPTYSTWGVDFGDGILRNPTQLYEAVFDVGMFIYLLIISKKVDEPGKLFRVFLNCYFSFRFLIEFIRVNDIVYWGMTSFQWVCILSLLYINRTYLVNLVKRGANIYG